MKLSTTRNKLASLETDALVVGIHAKSAPTGPCAQVDQALGGAITRLVEIGEITGTINQVVPILAPSGVQAGQVIVVGLGPAGKLDRGAAYRSAGAAAKHLAGIQRTRVTFCLADGWSAELIEAAVTGALVNCHGQDLYREEKKRFPFEEVMFSTVDEGPLGSGQILADAVNLARKLVNEPPAEIFPESFAQVAQQVADAHGLQIEVWDEQRLQQERCGSLLAVARGSQRPPRLVILRYDGGKPDAAPLALVGKGVTFDSGGLSLKPSDGMVSMKCDMAGAATVLGAMQAIARLHLPVHVVGLMGLVENMVSGDCYKLGDVLTARNGRTIEVHNTDAEGRLVLADVLDVAVEQGASKIIDLATLTGACVVALGNDVAGLMTNDQAWCDAVAGAATACGELAWQLPMFPEYGKQIESEVADIKNIGEGRWGGAITAAKFLEQFVGQTPWTHIDIAGPAFLEKPRPWTEAGGTGAFVRSLVEVVRSQA